MTSAAPGWLRQYWPLLVTAAVYLALASWYLARVGGNFTYFVHLDAQHPITRHFGGAAAGLWEARAGYDGMAYYAVARELWHPSALTGVVDYPLLRYRRIGYPLISHLLSGGQPALVAPVMLISNFAATLLGVALLQQLLAARGLNSAWALLYGLHPGVLLSFLYDLPTALAILGVLAALRWGNQGRRWAAGLALGAALLSWEVIVVPIILGWWGYAALQLVKRKQHRPAFPWTPTIAAGVGLLWELTLAFMFPGEMNLRVVANLGRTAEGWWRVVPHVLAGARQPPQLFLLLLLGITAASILLFAVRFLREPLSLALTLGVAQALLLAHLSPQNLAWPLEVARKSTGLWLFTWLYFVDQRDRLARWLLVGTVGLTVLLPWLLPPVGG